MNNENPFSIVKANDYSDEEIVKYWVGLGVGNDSIHMKLRPNELIPKYILGSKGCGKTHLLRYFSYESQKQRFNGDIIKLIKEEKYVGVYSRLDGLASSRFNVKKNHNSWIALYDYYFELFQTTEALKRYNDICVLLKIKGSTESKIIDAIKKEFNFAFDGLKVINLIEFLNSKRIDIDREIIDFAHSEKLNWEKIKPIFKFGDIIFGIPAIFAQNISELRNLKVIYILDEYEKLNQDWQKESLNTLVYEKQGNVTFWVGARRYGYTTLKTKTAEKIKDGHEFMSIYLDDLMREDPKSFNKFAEDLFNKRLEVACIAGINKSVFEKFDESLLLKELETKKELRHWTNLRLQLKKIQLDDSSILKIINELKQDVSGSPLEQKLKLFSFYQKWARCKFKVVANASIIVKCATDTSYEYRIESCNSKSVLREKFNKFKQDFLAQLVVENGLKCYLYSGFDELVNISDCNPRVFLTLMKLIIDDSLFKGDNPLVPGSKISLSSQYSGVNEASRWFFEEIETTGENRETLQQIMSNLIDFLYVNRFCDKPAETSPSSFYYRSSLNDNCKDAIKLAENEYFLIRIPNKRKDKTLGVPRESFQLNKTIAVLYNLPTSRRGVISLNESDVNAIFNNENKNEFRSFLYKVRTNLNAPFLPVNKRINSEGQELKLF